MSRINPDITSLVAIGPGEPKRGEAPPAPGFAEELSALETPRSSNDRPRRDERDAQADRVDRPGVADGRQEATPSDPPPAGDAADDSPQDARDPGPTDAAAERSTPTSSEAGDDPEDTPVTAETPAAPVDDAALAAEDAALLIGPTNEALDAPTAADGGDDAQAASPDAPATSGPVDDALRDELLTPGVIDVRAAPAEASAEFAAAGPPPTGEPTEADILAESPPRGAEAVSRAGDAADPFVAGGTPVGGSGDDAAANSTTSSGGSLGEEAAPTGSVSPAGDAGLGEDQGDPPPDQRRAPPAPDAERQRDTSPAEPGAIDRRQATAPLGADGGAEVAIEGLEAVDPPEPRESPTTDTARQDQPNAPGRLEPTESLTRLAAGRLPGGQTDAASGDNAGPRVDAARFVGRVGRAIETAQQRGGEVKIRLSPPELGALQIKLTVSEGVLTATLETETTAARNALLDNLPALRERLAEQEIRIEKFDVDVRDERGRQDWAPGENRDGDHPDRGNDPAPGEKTAAEPPADAAQATQTSVIDTSNPDAINLVA